MSNLIVQGIITHVLPEENGVGKASGKEWKKQTAVLQTQEQYPKYVAFDMFNNRIVPLQVGQSVQVQISVESREYQGKWYSNVNAITVAPVQAGMGMQMPPQGGFAQPMQGYQQPPMQGYQMPPQGSQSMPQTQTPQAPFNKRGEDLPF